MGAAIAATFIASVAGAAEPRRSGAGAVTEYPIDYPSLRPQPAGGHRGHGGHGDGSGGGAHGGSTHEITFDRSRGGGDLWVTGQNYDSLVRVQPGGRTHFHSMPKASGPHGIEFDRDGKLWVTLEFKGLIRALDPKTMRVLEEHDVRLDCGSCPEKVNTHPHGLGIGPDGRTIWFTGKATGTIGRIAPDGRLTTWALPTPASVPIYVRAGPDGNMWVTELTGNKIARVTPAGEILEIAIKTPNSRPIAIVPGPDGRSMWFSEEAGNKVGRIDLPCLARAPKDPGTCLAEYPVPTRGEPKAILAALAFDRKGDLWVQQYVDQTMPTPGRDHVVRIAAAGLTGGPDRLMPGHFTFIPVPTRATVMHRIIEGPDGRMWFTEMHANRVGVIDGR
jgi:virginiamycin B lyase